MMLKSVSVRMYDVGWGDCFLLRFDYLRARARHILIDFGTTAVGAAEERERLLPIAEDIRSRCGGKLDAVVATHRHRDHIGGFAGRKRSRAPGNLIAAMQPHLVVQPWTERPGAQMDTGQCGRVARALAGMERFSTSVLRLLEASPGEFDPSRAATLRAMLRQHYPNRHAVESLLTLGAKRTYVAAGSLSGLESVLPGFSIRVLGPAKPGSVPGKVSADPLYEAWRKCSFWDAEAAATEAFSTKPLFPGIPQWHPAMAPPRMRWFVDRINRLREDQILSLSRAVSSAVNNSSVVLLIEGFGHKLLFPGDVEMDGWSAIMQQAPARAALQDITLYKASHHGAGNGTPRSVWPLLRGRSALAVDVPLYSMVSRQPNKYPDEPRFLDELATHTRMLDTSALRREGRPHTDIELEPLRKPKAKLVA